MPAAWSVAFYQTQGMAVLIFCEHAVWRGLVPARIAWNHGRAGTMTQQKTLKTMVTRTQSIQVGTNGKANRSDQVPVSRLCSSLTWQSSQTTLLTRWLSKFRKDLDILEGEQNNNSR